VLAGQNLVAGVLAALFARERTGRGQRVSVSLLSSALAGLINQASGYLNAGVLPGRLGNAHPSIAPYQTFPTADRPIALAVGNDGQFARLAAVVGGLSPDDPRFATNFHRVRNSAALAETLAHRLRARPAAEWVAELTAAGVPCGLVNSVPEAFALAESLDPDRGQPDRAVRHPGVVPPAAAKARPARLNDQRSLSCSMTSSPTRRPASSAIGGSPST
jgi:crotonobetainyl-CoA:carnitine CoA-transferase CaiB-like acyl-CoA transferase